MASNTGYEIEGIRDPFLRFRNRKDKTSFQEPTRTIVKNGYEDWKKGERWLIKKGDEERYDKIKSWGIIPQLPTMSKVINKIIL